MSDLGHLLSKVTWLIVSVAISTSKHRLMFEVGRTFTWALLAPIIPKLAVIGFTFCQPVLVNRFVHFLQAKEHPESINIGYGLIAAYGFAYLGLAVSRHSGFKLLSLTHPTDLKGVLLPSQFPLHHNGQRSIGSRHLSKDD